MDETLSRVLIQVFPQLADLVNTVRCRLTDVADVLFHLQSAVDDHTEVLRRRGWLNFSPTNANSWKRICTAKLGLDVNDFSLVIIQHEFVENGP